MSFFGNDDVRPMKHQIEMLQLQLRVSNERLKVAESENKIIEWRLKESKRELQELRDQISRGEKFYMGGAFSLGGYYKCIRIEESFKAGKKNG